MAERPRPPRIIPNYMMPTPPDTPMPTDEQEQLASMAVASGSTTSERQIISFFSDTPPAILDAQISGSTSK